MPAIANNRVQFSAPMSGSSQPITPAPGDVTLLSPWASTPTCAHTILYADIKKKAFNVHNKAEFLILSA